MHARCERLLTSSTMNARMGDRSKVPPMGGMMPLKRLRYGSHSVLHWTTGAVNLNSQMSADKEPEAPLSVMKVDQICHAAACYELEIAG